MKSYLIDANLIVLLVVGSYDLELVAERRHKRCNAFDERDFAALDAMLGRAERLVCTPHALAEASNLLRLIGEPLRSALTAHLGVLLAGFDETAVASTHAAGDALYPRLGLTDCSLLVALDDHEILTTDLDLYIAALDRGCRATNFAHLRDD